MPQPDGETAMPEDAMQTATKAVVDAGYNPATAETIVRIAITAIGAAGYAIVPVATATQVAEFDAAYRVMKARIAETRESIRRGALGSTHRFKL